MKHVFTVHSPITFFCAYEVIKYENIDENDCILICSGYQPPIVFGKQVKSYSDLESSIISKLLNFNMIKSYDNYINKLVSGETFVAYIDLVHNYQRILITHPLCDSFNFIEEGMSSYLKPNDNDLITRLNRTLKFRNNSLKTLLNSIFRLVRGYNLRLLSLPYYPHSYRFFEKTKFYGFSMETNPGIPQDQKIILQPKVDLFNKDNILEKGESVFFVEESYFKAFGIDPKMIKEVHEKTVAKLKNELKNKMVYIKLRPQQLEKNSLWKPVLDEYGISFQFLPANFVLDSYLSTSNKSMICGTVSSLLFYGSIFGHQAYSNYYLFENKNETVFDSLKVYWKYVSIISEDNKS